MRHFGQKCLELEREDFVFSTVKKKIHFIKYDEVIGKHTFGRVFGSANKNKTVSLAVLAFTKYSLKTSTTVTK